MTTSYEDAVVRLYQAPLGEFVEERKRLARDLGAGGDKAGGKRLAKLGRPPVSAWAVNQLWWRERDAFEKLLATGKRLAKGDLGAMRAHREAVAHLRGLATTLLADAGHGTADATLRRVTGTLHAVAAAGGFEPDAPGTLAADRDPPGFETMTHAAPSPAPAPAPRAEAAPRGEDARAKKQRLAEENARKQAEAKRLAEEKARKVAERKKLEAALSTAKHDLDEEKRAVARLRKELEARETKLDQAQAAADALAERLANLD